MRDVKVSFIVPVYGTERYLHQCVDSILAQTYQDYEVLLIDDRSPDGCPAICDEYQSRDPRVRVIHKKENQGLGEARNTGMMYALGEYVTFVDSDDSVSSSYLENVMAKVQPETQILVSGITLCYEDSRGTVIREEKRSTDQDRMYSREERADSFLQLNQSKLFPFACNKIYRRDFLRKEKLIFERTPLIEDFLFNIRAVELAEYVQIISDSFYFYRKPVHETLASKYHPEFFDLSLRKYQLEKEFFLHAGCQDTGMLSLIHENMVKHFLSSIVRNRGADAHLTGRQQRQEIRKMLTNPQMKGLVREYVPRNRVYSLLLFLIRGEHSHILLLLGTAIQFAQTNMKPLYSKFVR